MNNVSSTSIATYHRKKCALFVSEQTEGTASMVNASADFLAYECM
jgi:hypothetical protein